MAQDNFDSLKKQWDSYLKRINAEGISLAFFKDPGTGKSSVSLTLLIISFNLVILGIIGKWGGILNVNIEQSLNLFYACSALYFGRKVSSGKSTLEVKTDTKNQE